MRRICNSSRYASSADVFLPISLSGKRSCTKSLFCIVAARKFEQKSRQNRLFLLSLQFAHGYNAEKDLLCGKKLFVREHLLRRLMLPNFPLFFHYCSLDYCMGNTMLLEVKKKLDKIFCVIRLLLFYRPTVPTGRDQEILFVTV